MRSRASTAVIALLSALAAVVAAVGVVLVGVVPCGAVGTQPRCQVALLPGPTEDTLALVVIDGTPRFDPTGSLLLTTVAVRDDLDLATWWRARRTPGTETVARETVFPRGDAAEVAEFNALQMEDSQTTATLAALSASGHDVAAMAWGAEVVAVREDAVTDGLEPGDVVIAVDDVPVDSSRSLVDLVARHAPGDTLRFEVAPGGEADHGTRLVDVVLGTEPGGARAYVGVLLVTAHRLPFEVRFDAGEIGGPSAGLMFALGVIELTGEEDLTGGAVIAGTGTITVDGAVGPVGGVRQKVAAASRDGEDRPAATAFLVPRANLADARRSEVEGELLLVPVDDLGGALTALADLRAGRHPEGAVLLTAS